MSRLAWSTRLLALLAFLLGAEGALAAEDGLDELGRMTLLAEAQASYERGLALRRTDPGGADVAFRKAVEGFQTLVDEGITNGRLHYNLANAHLQTGEVGRAILHYRRAEALIAGDPKLGHNLEYARSLRRNQIAPSGERALADALLGWHERTTLRGRVGVFALCYILFWAFLGAAVVRPGALLRWLAVAAAAICLAPGISVAADLFTSSDREAVVLADDVVVRKGNSEGFEPQFLEPVHQGLEVRVLDERVGWLYIELPNAKTGWIRADQAALI
jgi:hypothetical protein